MRPCCKVLLTGVKGVFSCCLDDEFVLSVPLYHAVFILLEFLLICIKAVVLRQSCVCVFCMCSSLCGETGSAGPDAVVSVSAAAVSFIADVGLGFQHHSSSLLCHMILPSVRHACSSSCELCCCSCLIDQLFLSSFTEKQESVLGSAPQSRYLGRTNLLAEERSLVTFPVSWETQSLPFET